MGTPTLKIGQYSKTNLAKNRRIEIIMMTPIVYSPTQYDLNELWIIGQIISLRYYDDHDKLVFTLGNTDGRFCVELCSPKTTSKVSRGDQVMVRGSLFSQWSGKQDTAKIRASLVQTLKNVE
jgi:hypothetical protein